MHLLGAQHRIKKYTDTKRKEDEFQVGDNVLLKLRPYSQKSLVSRSNKKLAAHIYGPYKMLERIGAVAYRLELLSSSSIHGLPYILAKEGEGSLSFLFPATSAAYQGLRINCGARIPDGCSSIAKWWSWTLGSLHQMEKSPPIRSNLGGWLRKYC